VKSGIGTDSTLQLRQNLRQAVLSGRVKIGDRLGSERKLADEFGIPRSLVGRVLEGLAEEGLVSRNVGRGGTVVLSNNPTRPRTGLKQMTCLLTHFRTWSATDNYFYDLIHGAQEAAREVGYSLNLWSPPANKPLDEAMEDALELCSEFAIVDEEFNDDFVEKLQKRGIRPILLNRPSRLAVDHVLADNASGIRQALTYLYKLGHRRIGYVGNVYDPNNTEREQAFIDIGIELGLDQIGHILPLDVNSRKLKGILNSTEIALLEEAKLTEEFLRKHTAVLGSNDYVAKAIYQKAKSVGMRVPEDLSVIGFGAFALAGQLEPKLTSVRIESGQIGRRAVQLFLDRLRGPEIFTSRTERILVDLRVQESCTQAGGTNK
jgi:DNA-binding LacI/PurR family transcriptional regulator